MTAKKPSQKLLSEEAKRRAINAAFRRLAARVGVNPDLLGTKISWGVSSGLSPEQEHELAKAKGFQSGIESMEEMLPHIRTQQDLDGLVQEIDTRAEQAPTMVRNELDRIRAKLPRRGGPGREPKLDSQQSTIVCKETLKLMGKKKFGITEALAEVSKMCPALLGKSVSPRTLRDAWDRRDEFLDE
jgi:hypothetical protein